MCGIVGVFGKSKVGGEECVLRAAESLRHRGPDGQGLWSWRSENGDFGVSLAHRRLSIIDLREVAGQPLVDSSTGSALVFNGEIYNFQELRRCLEAEGDRFVTQGDSEVILKGCLRYGTAFIRRLRGMFAFVLVDCRRRVVLVARDSYGIKPLYYHKDSEERFYFASEVRSLLISGIVEPRLDRGSISKFLWNGFVTGPASLVRSVAEFPRDHFLELPFGDMNLNFERIDSNFEQAAPSCSIPEAQDSVEDSVAAHLIADVPIGVFLSGGVDSSAIAVLASKFTSSLRTLSIGFDIQESDETTYAESIASMIGARHETVVVSGQEMLADMDNAIGAIDQPSFDGVNSWFVSRVAARAGLKVALSGAGGDELFGGYTSFQRLPRLQKISKIVSYGSCIFSFLESHSGRLGFTSRGKVLQVAAAKGRLARLYQLQYGMFPASGVRMLCADGRHEAESWGLDPNRLGGYDRHISQLSPLGGVSFLESEMFLGDRLLRDTDCMSMAHSIEVRVPLVDAFLARKVSGMSDHDRYGKLGAKQVLRGIAESRCGKEIFRRPKRGFEFPFDAWMRGPLKKQIESVLLDSNHARACGLDPQGLSRVWRLFLDRPGAVYWTRVWGLYVFLAWCQRHKLQIDTE